MNDTTCAAGVDRLMEYFEGILQPDVRLAIDAHVAQCARCAAFIASYRETPRLFRNATEVALPIDRQLSLRRLLRTRRER
jgi:anti-sigma factor RsiW